jgi:hypothetical protein
MDTLWNEGFEPWLLDWRGSGRIVDIALANGTTPQQSDSFDMDYAAEHDIPAALKKIREVRGNSIWIRAVGHCLGAGTLAQAIDGEHVKGLGLTHVVLLTLGLFYEPPFDSRLKTQDYVLERLMRETNRPFAIDPRAGGLPWAEELEGLYENWPHTLRPHQEADPSPVHEMCDRVSFMYGTPYFERNLKQEIHHSDTWTIRFDSGKGSNQPSEGSTITGEHSQATARLKKVILNSNPWGMNAAGMLVLEGVSGNFQFKEDLIVNGQVFATSTSPAVEGELPSQFGAIPLKMYLHAARNVRRGWAAKYDDPNDNVDLLQRDQREQFKQLKRVTLITGEKNQLWHRDSIDRMYEWLMRGTPMDNFKKSIIRDDGHQDLLWGEKAPQDVFPKILDGLRST